MRYRDRGRAQFAPVSIAEPPQCAEAREYGPRTSVRAWTPLLRRTLGSEVGGRGSGAEASRGQPRPAEARVGRHRRSTLDEGPPGPFRCGWSRAGGRLHQREQEHRAHPGRGTRGQGLRTGRRRRRRRGEDLTRRWSYPGFFGGAADSRESSVPPSRAQARRNRMASPTPASAPWRRPSIQPDARQRVLVHVVGAVFS